MARVKRKSTAEEFVVDHRSGHREIVSVKPCDCACCERGDRRFPGTMGLFFDPDVGRWLGYGAVTKQGDFDEKVSMFMNVLRKLNGAQPPEPKPESVDPAPVVKSEDAEEETEESRPRRKRQKREASDDDTEKKTVVNVASRQSGTVGVFWYGRQQAWNAQCFKDGRTFGKMFYIREHGDQEALRLAIEWRQSKIESGEAGRKQRLEPEFQSGVKGVQWHKVNQTWLCRWVEDGKQRSKTFKPGDHGGVDLAKKAAIDYRRDIEKRFYCFR